MELIKEKGVFNIPYVDLGAVIFWGNFAYSSVLWHDGFKLAFGKNNFSNFQLVEMGTGATCADAREISAPATEEALYQKFLEKLSKYNVTLGELIGNFNERNNLFVSAWQLSLLSIM